MSDNGSGRQPGGGRLQALLGMLTRRRRGGEETLRDAIEELIEDEPADTTEGESIRRDERHLLLNVLALRERTAVDVMVPRADIIAVAVDSDLRRGRAPDDRSRPFAVAGVPRDAG